MNVESLAKEICKEISEEIGKKVDYSLINEPTRFGTTAKIPSGYINCFFGPRIIFSMDYGLNGEISINSLRKKYSSTIEKIAKEKNIGFSKKKLSLFVTLSS